MLRMHGASAPLPHTLLYVVKAWEQHIFIFSTT
jgi:hypothetical protein